MQLSEYQYMSKRTIPLLEDYKELASNFSMGLSGEAGEVTDLLKKHLFHGHILEKDKLEEELGDVLFYLAGLATIHGLNLENIAEANVSKLSKRYPEGFDKDKSINREEYKNA